MPPRQLSIPEVRNELLSPVDLFICCGSFEERCLTISSVLAKADMRHVIVAEHANLAPYVHQNTVRLLELFGGRASSIALDSSSPVDSADAISESFGHHTSVSGGHIAVDITTFTHETLLLLLQLIRIRFSTQTKLSLLYTIAEEYDPGMEPGKKWLSKGTESIRSVLGHPGEMLPGRSTHLILLHGMETERSQQLIAEYEPAKLSLGTPVLSTASDDRHLSANRSVHAEVRRRASHIAELEDFEFSTVDPELTAQAICRQAARYSGMNTIVAPMNTKMATIGALLAATKDATIQLCYVQPSIYNYWNYSKPSTNCYLLNAGSLIFGAQ